MHDNNIFIFLDKFSAVISSLGLGCRFMVRNICFCLPGIIILMPHTAFAVTEPETVAAQHRAEITQRSGLGPLLLDQAENRPGVARVEAMGAKPQSPRRQQNLLAQWWSLVAHWILRPRILKI